VDRPLAPGTLAVDVVAAEPLSVAGAAPPRRGRYPVVGFLARRMVAAIGTLILASALIFAATNALPGDVAEVVLGRFATPQRVSELHRKLDLDRPLVVRYADWLGSAATGDLGQSAVQRANGDPDAPVSEIIKTPLRNSLILGLCTIILLVPLSLLVGTLAAIRAGRPIDYAASYSALVVGSLPEFVVGTFLIAVFFSTLDLLPPVALVPPGASPLDDPQALILPVATLLLVSLAFSARQVRSGVIEVMRQEYVTMARLSGVGERRVMLRYVLRNALAPSVQIFAQSFQYLFGGIIIVESVFTYPGIGRLLVESVSERDVTLVQGITLVLATAYIAINIVADLVVVLLVPKLRMGLR
jgi:peptide/nickel transport system permease protein